MFMIGSVSVFSKIAALRARISDLGAPSENALYERTSNRDAHVSLEKPNSATVLRRSPRSLQRDSTSIIRGSLYSDSRF